MLRARHHRPAEGAPDHPQPHPALRVPAAVRRRARGAGPPRSSPMPNSMSTTRRSRGWSRRGGGRRVTRSPLSIRSSPPAGWSSAPNRSSSSTRRSSLATQAWPWSPLPTRFAQGHDPRVLGAAFLDSLRDAFLVSLQVEVPHLIDDDREQFARWASELGTATLTRAMESVGTALVEMRQAADPRVPLEVALVRLTATGDDSSAALLERVERLEAALADGRSAPSAAETHSHGAAVERRPVRGLGCPSGRRAAAPTTPAPLLTPASARRGCCVSVAGHRWWTRRGTRCAGQAPFVLARQRGRRCRRPADLLGRVASGSSPRSAGPGDRSGAGRRSC